jgi:hypothetical protein
LPTCKQVVAVAVVVVVVVVVVEKIIIRELHGGDYEKIELFGLCHQVVLYRHTNISTIRAK